MAEITRFIPDLKDLLGPAILFVDLGLSFLGLLVITAIGHRISCFWRLIGLFACLGIMIAGVIDLYNMVRLTDVDFFQAFMGGR